jgi:hypothetical protein
MAHLRMSDSEMGREGRSSPQTPFEASISGVTSVGICPGTPSEGAAVVAAGCIAGVMIA